MALPSSCRPPEIEEEHHEYEEQKKKESLKVKLPPLNKVFMDTMVDWYHVKLSKEKRKKLKKRDIVCKARNVCHYISLNFSALPSNWLRQLYDEHEVEFISCPPAQRAKIRAKRRLKKAYIMGHINRAEMERKTEGVMSGSIPPEMIFPDTSPNSVGGNSASDNIDHDKTSGIIDLTSEPPPEDWMTAYAEGKYLPRVLKVHKIQNTKQIVVYYDYDAKVETEDGKPMGNHMVHEANNFLSWG